MEKRRGEGDEKVKYEEGSIGHGGLAEPQGVRSVPVGGHEGNEGGIGDFVAA